MRISVADFEKHWRIDRTGIKQKPGDDHAAVAVYFHRSSSVLWRERREAKS